MNTTRRPVYVEVYPKKNSALLLARSKSADFISVGNYLPPIRYLNPRIVDILQRKEAHFGVEFFEKKGQESTELSLPSSSRLDESTPKKDVESSEWDKMTDSSIQDVDTPSNSRCSDDKADNSKKIKDRALWLQNKAKKLCLNAQEFNPNHKEKQQQSQLEKQQKQDGLGSIEIRNKQNADEKSSMQLQEEYFMEGRKIFEEKIKNRIIEFSTSRYHKFIIQKVLERGSMAHKEWILHVALKNWLTLSCQQYGSKTFVDCIKISKQYFEESEYREFVDLLLREEKSVNEIYSNKYGIKIIRDCLNIFEGDDLYLLLTKINIMLFDPFEEDYKYKPQFQILDNSKTYLCNEQFGCLIINAIIEKLAEGSFQSNSETVEKILKRVIKRAKRLSENYYSNYMISKILEKFQGTQLDHLLRQALLPHIVELCQNKFSSNVIEEAIKRGDQEFIDKVVHIFCEKNNKNEYEVFEMIVNDQYGNYVIQKLYEIIRLSESGRQLEQILSHLDSQSKLLTNAGQHVKGQILDKGKLFKPKKLNNPPGFSSNDSSMICSGSQNTSRKSSASQNILPSPNLFTSSLNKNQQSSLQQQQKYQQQIYPFLPASGINPNNMSGNSNNSSHRSQQQFNQQRNGPQQSQQQQRQFNNNRKQQSYYHQNRPHQFYSPPTQLQFQQTPLQIQAQLMQSFYHPPRGGIPNFIPHANNPPDMIAPYVNIPVGFALGYVPDPEYATRLNMQQLNWVNTQEESKRIEGQQQQQQQYKIRTQQGNQSNNTEQISQNKKQEKVVFIPSNISNSVS